MSAVPVTLGGLTFNDGPDGDGDLFVVSDIDGWDLPPVEQVIVEKPLSDGGVHVRGRRTSWRMTISGWVVANTSMGGARRKLADAMDALVGAGGTLSVEEDDGTYELSVRLENLRTRQAADIAITFEADVVAVTPVKTTAP